MHVWPALMCLPHTMRRAATARSASAATIVGLFPPSSSVTGVRCFAAAAMTTLPTLVDPVKKMWSKRVSSSAVVSGTPPSTTATASSSRYCGMRRASVAAVAGASSDGLATTQLPAASAAAMGSTRSCTG